MFIDFINQIIYGDKGVYLSHYTIDKNTCKYVAFRMCIEINKYHNKFGYNVNTIQEEEPIIDEIVHYIVNYYSSKDNHNENIRLAYDEDVPTYYYDKVKGCWVVYFYTEAGIDDDDNNKKG